MPAAAGSVAYRFSTWNLPERERVSRWREEFGRTLVQVDIEPLPFDDHPFHAEAALVALPGIGMAVISGSTMRFDRTRPLAAKGDGSLGMIVNLEDRAPAAQFGRDVMLGAGDAIAVIPNEPGVLVARKQLGLVFPRGPIVERIRDVEDAAMRLIPKSSEPLRLLRRYLAFVRREIMPGVGSAELGQAVVNHIHDLIALAISPNRDTVNAGLGAIAAARLAACIEDIAKSFADPGLSVTTLARRQSVSPRYLQRLFETSGISFTARVQELRLQQAAVLLAESDQRIADIALQVGFADVSHFNRLFRARFGETPTAARGRR
jgi:AraC-like DNA-binding protein